MQTGFNCNPLEFSCFEGGLFFLIKVFKAQSNEGKPGIIQNRHENRNAWNSRLPVNTNNNQNITGMTRVLFESNRTVAWETALEELLRRSMVFSAVLYLVRTKDIKQVQGTFLQSFKKQMSKYTASRMALVPGKGVLPWKEKPTLVSRRGVF